MKEKPNVKIIEDEAGNKIIATRKPKGIILLHLKLKAERKRRELGTVDTIAKVFNVVRDEARHLYRNGDAYGFNHYVISRAVLFKYVIITERLSDGVVRVYRISTTDILTQGFFLNFKEQGFEKQVFIKRKSLTNKIIKIN